MQVSSGITDRLIGSSSYFKRLNDSQLAITPLLDLESEKLFAAIGLDTAAHKRFRELIQQKAQALRIMECLKPFYLRLEQLEEWWQTHPSMFQLTSVGIAIAHANLRRRGIGGFDLRTWIN